MLSLQLCTERCVKLFETILGSLPDNEDSATKTEPTVISNAPCAYVRSDSMKKAFEYLSSGEMTASSPKKTPTFQASSQGICIPATLLVAGVINKLLIRIDMTMGKLKEEYTKARYERLKVQVSQLEMLANIALQAAISADPNSLVYKPQSDPEWVRIKPFYTVDVILFARSTK